MRQPLDTPLASVATKSREGPSAPAPTPSRHTSCFPVTVTLNEARGTSAPGQCSSLLSSSLAAWSYQAARTRVLTALPGRGARCPFAVLRPRHRSGFRPTLYLQPAPRLFGRHAWDTTRRRGTTLAKLKSPSPISGHRQIVSHVASRVIPDGAESVPRSPSGFSAVSPRSTRGISGGKNQKLLPYPSDLTRSRFGTVSHDCHQQAVTTSRLLETWWPRRSWLNYSQPMDFPPVSEPS